MNEPSPVPNLSEGWRMLVRGHPIRLRVRNVPTLIYPGTTPVVGATLVGLYRGAKAVGVVREVFSGQIYQLRTGQMVSKVIGSSVAPEAPAPVQEPDPAVVPVRRPVGRPRKIR